MKVNESILKPFYDWAALKIKIHVTEKNLFPRRREIWWVSLGQNIGVETNGKNAGFERPIIVIKVFNTNSALVALVSSKVKDGEYLIKFTNPSGELNVANLSQLKTISKKRFMRKIGEIDSYNFETMRLKIKDFI